MSENITELLSAHVQEHESSGSFRSDGALGFVGMPHGYALMLNADRSHFYWLRHDGIESCIHWDMWAVYRGAKTDACRKEV